MNQILTQLLDVARIEVSDDMEVVGETREFLGGLTGVTPMNFASAQTLHEDLKVTRTTLRMRHMMRGCFMLYNRALYQLGMGPKVVLLGYGCTDGNGSVRTDG